MSMEPADISLLHEKWASAAKKKSMDELLKQLRIEVPTMYGEILLDEIIKRLRIA